MRFRREDRQMRCDRRIPNLFAEPEAKYDEHRHPERTTLDDIKQRIKIEVGFSSRPATLKMGTTV